MTRLNRFLVRFFYVENAFTFKGLLTLAAELLGLLVLLITANALSRPAAVSAANVHPVACFDLSQFEESYPLRGADVPSGLVPALREFIIRKGTNQAFVFEVTPQGIVVPTRPEDATHHIACWFTPRQPPNVREEYKRRKKALWASIPASRADDLKDRVEHAKLKALGQTQLRSTKEERGFDAVAAVTLLRSYSPKGSPLDVPTVLGSVDTRSVYHTPNEWKKNTYCLSEVEDAESLVSVLEHTLTDPLAQAIALEQFYDARWYVNWIEAKNTSRHAVASKAVVTVDHTHRGLIENLGGPLVFEQREQRLSASLGSLLPDETVWAVLRSKQPLMPSEIAVIADPTPVFDVHELGLAMLVLVPVCGGWVLGNVLARRPARQEEAAPSASPPFSTRPADQPPS